MEREREIETERVRRETSQRDENEVEEMSDQKVEFVLIRMEDVFTDLNVLCAVFTNPTIPILKILLVFCQTRQVCDHITKGTDGINSRAISDRSRADLTQEISFLYLIPLGRWYPLTKFL
jgi:hypothetical protein